MAYGTLAEMMINVGANLSPLGKGLNAAKGQLKSFNVIGSQVGSNLGNSFGAAALKIGLLTGAIYGVQQAFQGAMKAADEYRLGMINIASTLYDMMESPNRTQEDFNTLLGYSAEMYKKLELEAVKHFSSGKDLQLAWMILTQKGVMLRYDEINALGIVVDKIKLITQGQMSSIQITQEIRSMLNGQARVTDQLAILLHSKYGEGWKKIVAEQRKSGNLLKWLATEFEGLAKAQDYIYNTIEAQSTTLWTMIRRVGREGLAGAYQYVVDVLKTINEYLFEHEVTISAGIQQAWNALEPTITAVGLAIQSLAGYIQDNWDTLTAGIGVFGEILQWILQVIVSIASWIEENKKLVLSVLAIIIAYKGAVILGTIIQTVTIAVNALSVAFKTAALAGLGMSACIPVIGAIVAVIGLATWAAYGLSNALDKALDKQRGLAAGAAGTSIEEGEKLAEKWAAAGPKGEELAKERFKQLSTEEKREIDLATMRYKSSMDKYEEVKKIPTEIEIDPLGGISVATKNMDALNKKTQETGDNLKEVGEKYGLIWDEARKSMVYEGGYEARTPTEEVTKEIIEAAQKIPMKPGGVKDEKGGKGGKAPAKLSEWPAIKAERDKELELEKNRLNEIEKDAEAEIAINDNKYAQGILSGTQYAQALLDLNEKVYQGKLVIINKEREIEKEAYAFRKANIELEVARGALSPDKALIEQRKALAEYQKRNISLDKEFFDAGIEKTKALTDATGNLIKARKDLINLGMDLMTKFAWGPGQEQKAALLANAREFAAFEKKIKEMKFVGEKGKIEIDPEFLSSTREFAEAAKQLNLPWAEPLRLIVEELKNCTDPARIIALQGEMISLIPQMKATGKFQIENKAEIDAYIATITNGITSIVDAIMEGGADLNQAANNLFKGIFKDSLKKGMDFLQQTLIDLFTKMFQSLGPGLASAIMGVIGIIGMMLTSKGSKSFAASGVESGVTAHEAVRGVIAGETSIPIAQISVSLSEAMSPHLSVLRQIEANTRGGGSQPVNVTYRNDSGNRASSKEAMDAYFREYLLQGAGS